MVVSFTPLIVPLLLLGIPLCLLIARGKRASALGMAISCGFVAALFLWVYVPGWLLMVRAYSGDPASQYRLAKWCENHSETIGQIILWPVEPDVYGGFAWLEIAAQQNYPPALYAVGMRLKYGELVPRPDDWHGPGGNVFRQPSKGQPLIDRALKLGYQPQSKEELFYWHVFRGMYVKDRDG